jgi:molecular chaperone Hsp33
MTEATDSVLRAITNDGAFRVMAARTTQTVQGVMAAQRPSPDFAVMLGDLVTGTVLFRETMAPELRVQGIVRGAGGRTSLVADSHPSGMTRALIQRSPATGEVDLGPGSVLQMMRSLPSGRTAQGIVELPAGANVSEAMMLCLQSSEQIVCTLGLGTVIENDTVTAAGGYLVQLLPEVERGPLMVMTERLPEFSNVAERIAQPDFSPRRLLGDLLFGMPFTELDESQIRYQCWCDELRLVSALATLKRSDIESLLADGEMLEISCDYCGKQYRIAPAQLRGLLAES